VVLVDTFDDDGAVEVRSWVEGGGTLVLATPFTDALPNLGGDEPSPFDFVQETRGACDIAGLDGLQSLDLNLDEAAFGFTRALEVQPDDRSCVGDGDRAFVVARPVGAGWVIGLGGPEPLVNESLGDADNAVLAAALLAPHEAARVAVVDPVAVIGDGPGRSLVDVIAPGVKRALLQLLIGFVLFALFKARRLGRVIREPLPVQIAGSELTVAVGQLLQQTRDPAASAHLLRNDLRRVLSDRLGVPQDAAPDVAADAVASRVGGDRATILSALSAPVTTDAELVQLGRTIESIRQEVAR
jgi:hypothetical protein